MHFQIIRLESERTQWEQRYLEESAMRQVAIDAASIPKDAKIAALEKNSAESEKMIAEARSDKLKQFQEMQNTQVSFIVIIFWYSLIVPHFFFIFLLFFSFWRSFNTDTGLQYLILLVTFSCLKISLYKQVSCNFT